ncbi:zf-HC2 domain-containing protein [Nitrolancea hollandica]|uniref:Zinc-finger domain-containing protein n=1 Tax=Nitrolancea hollandica Lb TaxID=1129897 RepID=I4EJ00_9BACT|nr:zf-HC2 domain-containing protein [Nitrolancea hollandica]CCF84662.1 hypothetical protein NITHO_3710003 [Nitrolancea hollandica Lb]
MDCAEARFLLSQSLDDELPAGSTEADAMERHLLACATCSTLRREFVAEQELLADLWAPVAAPAGFADRVTASLPRQAPRRRHQLALVAAMVLVVLAGSLLAQSGARASIGLFLRQVVLRETPAQTMPSQTTPMTRLTLAEAQKLVPWRIRQPSGLPDGYRLSEVYAGNIHSFAVGPTVVLHYQSGDGAAARSLEVMELQTAVKQRADEPVAPGAARQVPVGNGTGLLIDGRWGERDGRQVWEPGTMLRLIVEDGDLVFQLQADPKDGWNAEQLTGIAATLR